MASRKVATTIYITAEQDRQLKLLSQATGDPMAQFIREGIDLVLEKYQHRLPKQLGLSIFDDTDR
jgi:predicted DNA-binding protein